MNELIIEGFRKLCDLRLCKKGMLDRSFCKRGQYKYIVYAMVVNGQVMYIGKTNCLWKRTDTYRNAMNWKTSWVSSKKKSKWIIDTIKSDGIELWYKQCQVLHIGRGKQKVTVTNMGILESRLIKKIKPVLNNQLNEEYDAKAI